MATTATTTGPPRGAAPGEAFALLRRLTEVLLAWSYEGTFRAELTVQRVGASLTAEPGERRHRHRLHSGSDGRLGHRSEEG